MPELEEVVKNDEKDVKGKTDVGVVDATVIDEPKKKTTKKPVDKKPGDTKKKKVADTAKTDTAKTDTAKTEVSGDDDTTPPEPKLRRPPLEMLTKDITAYILEQDIVGTKLVKLEYKCGKIIFGIANPDGKDFRVMAFKARKKTKSVAGKSRCIYYFGMTKDLKVITKNHTGTTTTDFGKCSVQVKKPIQLILDKTTFDENFNQDAEVAMATLKKLVDLCILHKEDQWNEIAEKKAAKIKAAEEKEAKKKTDLEKKTKAIADAKKKREEEKLAKEKKEKEAKDLVTKNLADKKIADKKDKPATENK